MYIILKGLFAAISVFFVATPQIANEHKVEYTAPVAEVEPHPQQEFIDFLVDCESGGDPKAINPLDRDGTPSWGLLQFKPDTLFYYIRKYNILKDIERQEIMNVIFDGDLQVRVLEEMLPDSEVDWYQEFPTCYRRWLVRGGYPL